MFQIDEPGAPTTLPAIPTAGTPGFFQEGNAATGTAPVSQRAWFLNMLMLELRGFLDAVGLAPSKASNNQVVRAAAQLGRRRIYVANSNDAKNRQNWKVPINTFLVRVIGTAPGNRGGAGSQAANGQYFAGGASSAGYIFDADIPVNPGDVLTPLVGSQGGVTSLQLNGVTILTSAGGVMGGDANPNGGGIGGSPNPSANFVAQGYGARFLPPSYGSSGITTGSNNCLSIGGVVFAGAGAALASGQTFGGNPGIGPGNGGTGGGGPGFTGGAGADGDMTIWF